MTDPTQASAARLTAIAERLKALIRNNSSPKCRLLSLGDNCQCGLCDVDRLLAQIDTLRQQVEDKFGGDALVIEAREGEKRMLAKLEDCRRDKLEAEQEQADAKASEQRQYDQSVEATVRMLQAEQHRDAARAALSHFGQHETRCPRGTVKIASPLNLLHNPCTCGLDAVLHPDTGRVTEK